MHYHYLIFEKVGIYFVADLMVAKTTIVCEMEGRFVFKHDVSEKVRKNHPPETGIIMAQYTARLYFARNHTACTPHVSINADLVIGVYKARL